MAKIEEEDWFTKLGPDPAWEQEKAAARIAKELGKKQQQQSNDPVKKQLGEGTSKGSQHWS